MNTSSYLEYPIRCKTCGEQIACYVESFKQYLSTGLSAEDALNQLGIMNVCSRIAMISPSTVFFDVENRLAIEGIVNVSQVDDEANRKYLSEKQQEAKMIFNASCKIVEPLKSTSTTTTTTPLPNTVESVQERLSALSASSKLKGILPPVSPRATATATPTTTVQSLRGINRGTASAIKPLLIAKTPEEPITPIPAVPVIPTQIDVNLSEKTFLYPEIPGVPTINSSPVYPNIKINVGAGKQCAVLSGRTFLAR